MLHHVFDFGRRDKSPGPARTGHDIEVIHLIAIGRAAGVMPPRDQRDVVVLHRHRLVQGAVLGIDPLDAEALAQAFKATLDW